MDFVLKNAKVYMDNKFETRDLFILKGQVFFSSSSLNQNAVEIDCLNKYIFPGFVDVHTHLREPGFSYKETVKTGTEAAASMGYNALFTMPNLNPVPDSVENIKIQQDIIDRDALVNVYPLASITVEQKGETITDIDALSKYTIAFSDDGRGVQNDEVMEKAMKKAKENGKTIVAHCEDNSLLNGGYIHDGEYAKIHGHKGIPSESEYKQIERDLKLVKKIGVKYHVCHVSAKESVELIRSARKEGLDVTCETGPHYLVLNDMMLKEDGGFKMNPPIRAEEDRLALIEGIKDGTVGMLATDHAPHSKEEKSKGLLSMNGIVGLETAFPVLYTDLVVKGIISLEKLVEIMSVNPAKRFDLAVGIKEGEKANLCVYDLESEYVIDKEKFLSKGKSTPFNGKKVKGRCLMNFVNGKLVYEQTK